MILIGIDGCPGGWIGAFFSHNQLIFRFEVSLQALLSNPESTPFQALIDMPIGAPKRDIGIRQCDAQAKKLLGPKARSRIFDGIIRDVWQQDSHQAANGLHRELCGRGLSIQSWNLLPKIRELDHWLLQYDDRKYWMKEAHPELAFQFLNGGQTVMEGKKTEAGRVKRHQLLCSVWPDWDQTYRLFRTQFRKKEVGDDDLLDAAALLAMILTEGQWHVLGDGSTDSEGFPLAIWTKTQVSQSTGNP